jgi:hypothetical protein
MDRDVTHKILYGPKQSVGDRPVHKLPFGPKCRELLLVVRKNMDVNEHERLLKITLRYKLK